MAENDRNVQMDRVSRAFVRAHEAGNTEDARRLAAELRRLRDAGPNSVTVGAQGQQSQNPFRAPGESLMAEQQDARDYSFLENRGINVAENPRARELYDGVMDAREAGDAEAERMNLIRLSGYLSGQDALDGQRGQESAVEGAASRAETALRGFGQGAFGLGDFSAALGSWLQGGGPFSDHSIREHFAFERNRREGMAQQNRGTATAGYLGGAVLGGGGLASSATRGASRLPGALGRAGRFFQRTPGAAGQVSRAAAGGAVSSGTAATLEGGDPGEIATATALGAVAGPVGERVLDGASGLVRGGIRRANPQAAADAAIRRRMLPGQAGYGRAGARTLNREVSRIGDQGTILQAAQPDQAARLGQDATQSEDAMRLATRRLPEIEEAAAPRMERAVQGETPITSLRQAEEVGEDVLEGANRRLQNRLAQTADTGAENVTPDAIRAIRDQYGNEVMGEIGEEIVTVPNAGNILQRDAVRSVMENYARAADPDEAAVIRDILNQAEDGPMELTLRQIDSFRRAMDSMGEADPALRRGLTDVADLLSEAAQRNGRYAGFLDTYSRLSRTMEGAQMGGRARNASVSEIEDFLRIQRQGEGVAAGRRGAADVGLNRRSQRAVAEEARRSPRRARAEAERIREEPARFDTILGPRAGATRRVAEEGLEEVERVERGVGALREAPGIMDEGGSSSFQRAVETAREGGVEQQFSDVARTRLAEAAGESGQGAFNVASRLSNNPGLRRRARAVMGDDAYNAVVDAGRREARAGEATQAFARGATSNLADLSRKEQEALISAIDIGVMATDRWSGSFGANALIRLIRQVNGDETRAFALARALTEGDRATQRRTLARLAQLGASLEEQKMYARAAGAGAGIMTGQAVAEDIEE